MVTDGEESLLWLSLRRIHQVVCYGRVGLSTPFLQHADEHGDRSNLGEIIYPRGLSYSASLTGPLWC